jgi:hypothetical protein
VFVCDNGHNRLIFFTFFDRVAHALQEGGGDIKKAGGFSPACLVPEFRDPTIITHNYHISWIGRQPVQICNMRQVLSMILYIKKHITANKYRVRRLYDYYPGNLNLKWSLYKLNFGNRSQLFNYSHRMLYAFAN